ncbi:hypothetical protein GCM10023238_14870 [Streptomyces heliomycini]
MLHRRKALPYHANGMALRAYDASGAELLAKTYYSVGGGFVVDEDAVGADRHRAGRHGPEVPLPHGRRAAAPHQGDRLSISALMLENERAWRSEEEIREGLLEIWRVMRACVDRGMSREGILPGGLKVRRRAANTARKLRSEGDPQALAMEWITLYAMAVNEENAAGGRVVTAPTNGAAGIIPAVLHYYMNFVPGADEEGVVRFLLAAGAIGMLFKENASISGAEVGCQGEVGSACSMAAGALAEVLGGSPEQVENAAEIGMEHNLGLTCDPVGGLVQIPCIERNGMAAVKAVTAAPDGDARRRLAQGVPGQGHQDDEGDRRGHVGQVQGDGPGRARGEHHRVLTTSQARGSRAHVPGVKSGRVRAEWAGRCSAEGRAVSLRSLSLRSARARGVAGKRVAPPLPTSAWFRVTNARVPCS